MSQYIHGPTDPDEVVRLEHQAAFIGPRVWQDFAVRAGVLVLDLGTGVGAMAAQLARRFPGVRLVRLDLQRPALQTARANHPGAHYVQGNAMRLPFQDAAFDHVHGSWIVEHVPDPVAALGEVRRVLRVGGTCRFLEVDNASLRTVPAYLEVEAEMAALNRAQVAADAGDPYIGQRLGEVLSAAGFVGVEARILPVVGTADDPAHYRDFCRVFVDIFESVEGLLGPAMAPTIRAAAERIRALPAVPGSVLRYAPVLGIGTR